MRRWLALPLVAAAMVARPVLAEDGKHAVRFQKKWKVGDVVTTTSSKSHNVNIVVKTPDGTVVNQDKQVESDVYELVTKALEVDGDGQPTKSLVFVKSWSKTTKGAEDTSLAGLHIEVTGVGEARKAVVATPGAAPTPVATDWIEENLGGKGAKKESMHKILVPPKPVGVGDTWTPDAAAIATLMSSDRIKMAPDKAKVTARLDAVDGDVGTFVFDLTLPSESMSNEGMEMKWQSGGVFEIKLTLKAPFGDFAKAHDGESAMALKGVIEAGGATVDFDMDGKSAEKAVEGGEVPKVEAPK